jgi:orotidine-5'-phosphate decarboxylase
MNTHPKIFCAIDKPDLNSALKLCEQIASTGIGIKLGMEFFNALGPQGILDIHDAFPNTPIFVDLKYHDIPNTVAGAIRSITSQFKPAYLNVHAAGGLEMMRSAKAACPPETKLIAVTILTSLCEDDITKVGYEAGVRQRVVQMAKLTQEAGLDGVVCSSHEIEAIRETCGDDFTLMVPGIRPYPLTVEFGITDDDQSRVMTPIGAIKEGATHLVIGRPISQAENPAQVVQDILDSITDDQS